MIIEDRHYDVIVIGTGAGGATLAAELADGGRSVLVLERGQSIPPEDLKTTGTELFRKERFHPKESWFGTDGDPFPPQMLYGLGGNSKIWGGVLERMREREFGAVRLQKGSTPAWELTYDDFAPYYDRAERRFQVHGKAGVDPTEPARQADYGLAPRPIEPVMEELRSAGISASLKEHLALLAALDADVIDQSPEEFYYLARATLVKDEALLDRFDQVFGKVFKGIFTEYGQNDVDVPADWLKAIAEKYLSPEEMAKIEKMGSWDELMETLKKRLEEQEKRHEGGNKWVGTGGTSPYGNSGYNPEGVRIGGESKHKRAVKVWDKREFQNLDNTRELGTRNIKIAMRRLRRFARDGAVEELDIDGTINGTARKGLLDIQMRPERRNAIKVLLMLDVGGSMDPFIKLCEELFSAATSEFKNLEFFYFHNCPYEGVWKDNKTAYASQVIFYPGYATCNKIEDSYFFNKAKRS
jgi:uncharacterized protein with von Willebrand factor type A (vWA) domain